MQQDHRRAIGRAVFLVGDVEDVGADGFALHPPTYSGTQPALTVARAATSLAE